LNRLLYEPIDPPMLRQTSARAEFAFVTIPKTRKYVLPVSGMLLVIESSVESFTLKYAVGVPDRTNRTRSR
jgi:hypothetical protein